MCENAALRKIFGLIRVKRNSSAGCCNQDCAAYWDSAVSDISLRSALRLLAGGQLGDRGLGAGRELGVGEKSVRIRTGNDWLWY